VTFGIFSRTVAASSTMHQPPRKAKGYFFVVLEDETGVVNAIVCKAVRDKQRAEFLRSKPVAVYCVWHLEGEIVSARSGCDREYMFSYNTRPQ